ncbi:MAG TPA: RlpA-like double-psi beta-barrel domain-containing protein [Solirubrobacterales bacterium]|nr:RlpA-like double-psi beta-barrel domain-containing protein [Solirubrobacterales bacterium]
MIHSLRLGKLHTLFLLAVAAICAVVASLALNADSGTAATRAGGGITMGTTPTNTPSKSVLAPRFGNRALKEGMVGDDVRILKGIVRSKALLVGTPLTTSFDAPTTDAVKSFQEDASIKPSGVVNKSTSKTLVRSMKKTEASWYGPGLYGNGVACGGTLRPGTVGVAHKTLPCGSKVLVGYRGRYLMTKVIDRGPYIAGRALDLTYAGAEALNFIDAGVANVRYAVVKRK